MVATPEVHAIGVKSMNQIAKEAADACHEAVTAQKAMEQAAKVVLSDVEAAREAAWRMSDDEF